MTSELTDIFCFMIASLAFAAIFHDNINYIAHHKHLLNGVETRTFHASDQRIPGVLTDAESESSASIHKQHGCVALPSGCAPEPR